MLIDGPRQPPARGGRPDALVVFLHGYGSNGADLMSLAPYWAKILPGAQFLAPNAPDSVPMAPGGYQWFPITQADPRLMAQGAAHAAGVVDRFLDREMARYQLPANRVALVGFSQGTMMALQVGLRRAEALGAILGFSGALPGAERLKDEIRRGEIPTQFVRWRTGPKGERRRYFMDADGYILHLRHKGSH